MRHTITILILMTTFLAITPSVFAAPLNAPADDFVITVKTDNLGSSADTQFTIPTTGGGYNYNVDCNDDGTDEATAQTGNYTCNYASAGTYRIRIKDNTGAGTGFPRIYFNDSGDKRKLLQINQWGTGKWTSMENAFSGCASLRESASDAPDLSNVTSMDSMFEFCGNLNQDISNWDTSTITNMNDLFADALFFNQDIGGWDTSSVTTMNRMFVGNEFNQDISTWDVSNVKSMVYMFGDNHKFNQDISNWDTSSVTNMEGMFYATPFNQDIGNWDTSSVTTMWGMFRFSNVRPPQFDQDIGNWDVSALTDAGEMFSGVTLSTTNYDALLNGWNAQNLKNGVEFGGGNSVYCAGAKARRDMINSDGWAVTDGGGCTPTVLFGANTTPNDGATLTTGPTQIKVEFDVNMVNDATDHSATYEDNYLLVEIGANSVFDTLSCNGGVQADDTKIIVDNATYDDSNPYIATLGINGGTTLPAGTYRLFVCGTTSIWSQAGIELNQGTSDSILDFTVEASSNSAPSSLPKTGFRHGEVTQLAQQPAAKAYTATAMLLEIPKLGVSMPIVGVPQTENGWDVSWLGNSAGYLAGSAFPTWTGNTVITGHVWDAYNQPGAFAKLKTLKYGDQIQIQAWGETYTYEVRDSKLLTKKNINAAFQSEQYDWVTLVTCEFYNPFNGEYLFRRAVRAVLVSVK